MTAIAQKPNRKRQAPHTAEQIERHAAVLSAHHYDVLLAALHEPKMEALAAAMNIPVGTVKSRLNRAREKLHKLVAAEKPA